MIFTVEIKACLVKKNDRNAIGNMALKTFNFHCLLIDQAINYLKK